MFAAEEDFGILPVEAQACGTPVIAFGRGGALETVRDRASGRPTGLFFDVQSPEAVTEAVRRFEQETPAIDSRDCREHALQFSTPRFAHEFTAFVERAWSTFTPGGR